MQPVEWVFGYGSLMWDPGFAPAETLRARLDGYHRSFCMKSIAYRGTHEDPGLVLALDADPGAHCWGLALRIPAETRETVVADLRARELVTYAYTEAELPITLEDGRRVGAMTFVVCRDHAQYAGVLSAAEQAAIIARARGQRGPNADYLFNTARHLAQLGVADRDLDQLAEAVRRLLTPSAGGA